MFNLNENENVAVLVKDGQFGGVVARKENDVYQNADLIQEAMVSLKKHSQYNHGKWMWVFTDDFQILSGRKL